MYTISPANPPTTMHAANVGQLVDAATAHAMAAPSEAAGASSLPRCINRRHHVNLSKAEATRTAHVRRGGFFSPGLVGQRIVPKDDIELVYDDPTSVDHSTSLMLSTRALTSSSAPESKLSITIFAKVGYAPKN